MSAFVTPTEGTVRQYLTRWELCASAPGALDSPEVLALEPLRWIGTESCATVAECLRQAGEWSLEAPALRLDSLDWWFRTRFAAPDRAPGAQTLLGFDGLATVADVWLNGRLLFSSDNMFLPREHRADEALQADNELVIRCRALDPLLAARRPRPRWRTPMVEHQQLRWFRTTLLGRTPGWSPPAPPVGPWRPVWIETRTGPYVSARSVRTGVRDGRGWAELECEVVSSTATPAETVEIEWTLGRDGHVHAITLRPTGSGKYAGRIEIADVALWWPHTHGEPALYEARLQIRVPGATATRQIDLGRVGFRTLELNTRDGAFELQVNGVPIFCRGACWTPLDPVSLRNSPHALAEALAQVRNAGMNMLRVGGMTVYEGEDFLAGLDENGILLWQDFMFANMSYPEEDPAFVASVTAEARAQLDRLAPHACLAVLCGNSEAEQQAAMWGAPREEWSPRLFHSVLADIARERCPDVPYWPSSAHGGAFPHQGNVGTTSYYGVGAYLRPLEDARRAEIRFASECLAFANIPEDATLARIAPGTAVRSHHPAWKARVPRDLGAGWDFDDVRDFYVAQLFDVDTLRLRYCDNERYLELGRIAPGEVMAAVFGEWRRKRSSCRGGLVWFLRDLWCGAGWGILDALGNPKSVWHALRRVLQPRAVFISDEGGNGLILNVVNESREPLEAVLEVVSYRDAQAITARAARTLRVPARETLELAVIELFPGFADLSYAYRFGPPAQDLVVASLREPSGATLGQAFHFDRARIAANRGDPGLSATATPAANGAFDVKVRTRGFAQSVRVEAEHFRAADEYFHLAPGDERTVRLSPLVADAARPLRGRVHAINALVPSRIETVG